MALLSGQTKPYLQPTVESSAADFTIPVELGVVVATITGDTTWTLPDLALTVDGGTLTVVNLSTFTLTLDAGAATIRVGTSSGSTATVTSGTALQLVLSDGQWTGGAMAEVLSAGGPGESLVAASSPATVIKRLLAGTNMDITPSADDLMISTIADHVVDAGGAGQSLIGATSPAVSLKHIIGGTNVIVTSDSTGVTISSSVPPPTYENLAVAGGETLSATIQESILTTYLSSKPVVTLAAAVDGFNKRVSASTPASQTIAVQLALGSFLSGGPFAQSTLLAYQNSNWQPKQDLCWIARNFQQQLENSGNNMSGAISGDGNTVALAQYEIGPFGLINVYTRSGTTWTLQQGGLVATGYVGSPQIGKSLALSADGNTLAAGGWDDNNRGAVWIFTRSGSVWSQQGGKLVMSTAAAGQEAGIAVGLSADGNTLVVGGDGVSTNVGGGWVWTRSGGVWTEQAVLSPTGTTAPTFAGSAAAISADGNTIALGGEADNSFVGGVWIFVRSGTGTTWTQQAGPVFASGAGQQGSSVALSADGNTLVSGAPGLNSNHGGAFVFNRSSLGAWTETALLQDGVPTSTLTLGGSVAISDNARTIYVGKGNSSNVWIFVLGSSWRQLNTSGAAITVSGGNRTQGLGVAADGRTLLLVDLAKQQVFV